jgi:hypothetical protein
MVGNTNVVGQCSGETVNVQGIPGVVCYRARQQRRQPTLCRGSLQCNCQRRRRTQQQHAQKKNPPHPSLYETSGIHHQNACPTLM